MNIELIDKVRIELLNHFRSLNADKSALVQIQTGVTKKSY
jgi:hypothetical protein